MVSFLGQQHWVDLFLKAALAISKNFTVIFPAHHQSPSLWISWSQIWLGSQPLAYAYSVNMTHVDQMVCNTSDTLICHMLFWRSLPWFQKSQHLASQKFWTHLRFLTLQQFCIHAFSLITHFLSIRSAPAWVFCSLGTESKRNGIITSSNHAGMKVATYQGQRAKVSHLPQAYKTYMP